MWWRAKRGGKVSFQPFTAERVRSVRNSLEEMEQSWSVNYVELVAPAACVRRRDRGEPGGRIQIRRPFSACVSQTSRSWKIKRRGSIETNDSAESGSENRSRRFENDGYRIIRPGGNTKTKKCSLDRRPMLTCEGHWKPSASPKSRCSGDDVFVIGKF